MNALRKWFATLIIGMTLIGVSVVGALVPVPPLTERVTDLTGTLTRDQKAALENTLARFEQRKGAQIAVLIVPTTEPETIEQYSLRVVDEWKLGRRAVDDGALLIVAKNDRTLRIEVGYGLEGVLNDALCNRIIREIIVPRFREGDFYGGIEQGVNRMIGVAEGEPLPPPERLGARGSTDMWRLAPIVFMLAVVLGGVLRALFGRLPGAAIAAGGTALAAWLLTTGLLVTIAAAAIAFVLTLTGTGIGGYVGTYGFGRRGGSGDRHDGFRGGGGGFGGGGASGRW